MTKKIIKTDEEWRAELTPDQYAVTRGAGTAYGKSILRMKNSCSGHCRIFRKGKNWMRCGKT